MSALSLQVQPTLMAESLPVVIDNWYRDQRRLAPQLEYKAASAAAKSVAKQPEKEEKRPTLTGVTAESTSSADSVRSSLVQAHRLLARSGKMGKGRGGMGKPITIKLCTNNVVTSAAATALAVSIGLIPSSTDDWSSISSLYDEVRVVGARIHYRIYTSAVTADSLEGVLVYDPIEGSALATLSNALAYRHHALFSVPAGPTARTCAPAPHTSHGFWSLNCKVYNDSVRNVTSTAITNGWMSTSDASDVWGYWKFLVSPASSAVTVSVSYLMEMSVEFRSRQ